ncbi:MAG: phosphate ABC transporter permease subunit PstC [Rhodospirillales bacterium]
MFVWSLLLIVAIAAVAFLLARSRMASPGNGRLHSLPGYHGLYVALWTGLPSLLLLLFWTALHGPLMDHFILHTLPADMLADAGTGKRQLLLSEIQTIANGQIFGQPNAAMLAAAETYKDWKNLANLAMLALGFAAALLGLSLAWRRLAPAFRARQGVERVLNGIMFSCAAAAVLTTLGIMFSLLFESARFFEMVPLHEFLFGLNWEPQIPLRDDQIAGLGAFGAIPVFAGTLLIAAIAMLIATPIGILSAIYLSEFASSRFRTTAKPLLEMLAGVPTIVYGFFAILVVAPALRQFGASIGLDVAPNSAFAAGAVMGFMIIPFVSSLSDDAISAVPHSLREGSYGLGATQAETIRLVLLPAALPGIVGGVLLAVSRAIGETMIVVMAAGLIAKMTANPLDAVTTVTVQIVTLLIGDTSFDSPKTLAAFALGLMLFIITLILNVIALKIVQKYREKYD